MRGFTVRGLLIVLLGASAAACATGRVATAGESVAGPLTRAERTNYLETSHYADVIAFLDSLHGRHSSPIRRLLPRARFRGIARCV